MKKNILITGASSGIGKICANYLTNCGNHVIGTSRKSYIDDFGYPIIQMDVTDAASVSCAISRVTTEFGNIDVLINNAGMGIAGPIISTPLTEAKLQFETNFFGLLQVSQHVANHMKQQHGGLIINMSSIAGKVGLPFQGLYSASKFAVEGVSQAMRMELAVNNIKVVLVNPGDFKTNFTQNRVIHQESDTETVAFQKALDIINKNETNGGDPIEIAKVIHRIIRSKNPKTNYFVGSSGEKIFTRMINYLPSKQIEKILSRFYGI